MAVAVIVRTIAANLAYLNASTGTQACQMRFMAVLSSNPMWGMLWRRRPVLLAMG